MIHENKIAIGVAFKFLKTVRRMKGINSQNFYRRNEKKLLEYNLRLNLSTSTVKRQDLIINSNSSMRRFMQTKQQEDNLTGQFSSKYLSKRRRENMLQL